MRIAIRRGDTEFFLKLLLVIAIDPLGREPSQLRKPLYSTLKGDRVFAPVFEVVQTVKAF
jgi:hypothetical protein